MPILSPSPPVGEPLQDDKIVESLNGDHLNGHEDVVMENGNDGATPGISADFSMASLEGGSTTATRSHPEDGEDDEPPAKRARLTDTEMASTAHVSFCLCLVHVLVTGVLISSVSCAFIAFQVCNSTPSLSQSIWTSPCYRFNISLPDW